MADNIFDKTLGALHGLPDVLNTRPTTLRTVPPFGIGGTFLYAVQTYRQTGEGDTIFLEYVSDQGTVRVVIPPTVAEVIARQREQLTDKARSRAAKRAAEDRKARGIVPAFLRKKKKAKARAGGGHE